MLACVFIRVMFSFKCNYILFVLLCVHSCFYVFICVSVNMYLLVLICVHA